MAHKLLATALLSVSFTALILALAGCTVTPPYTPEPIPLGTPEPNP